LDLKNLNPFISISQPFVKDLQYLNQPSFDKAKGLFLNVYCTFVCTFVFTCDNIHMYLNFFVYARNRVRVFVKLR